MTESDLSPQVQLIHVRHRDCEPWQENPRRQAGAIDESLRELVQSISANGVRQSLTVRRHPESEGKFQIAAGARRWHALGLAIEAGARPEDDPLPVRIEELDDFQMKIAALEENLQRKPMTVMEEAEAYDVLARNSGSRDTVTKVIADRVGKSRRHVQSYIAFARKLSKAAKDALSDGRISVSHARILTGVPKCDQDRFLEQEVGKKPLRMDRKSLRAVLGERSGASKRLSPGTSKRDALHLRALAIRTAAVRSAIERRPEIALRLAALHLADQARGHASRLDDLRPDVETLVGSTKIEPRWQTLASLRVSQLHALLARILAITFAPRLASLDAPHDLVEAIGAELKLDHAIADHVDETFFSLCSKSQLLEMAVECGATTRADLPAFRKKTVGEIRKALLDRSATGSAWVPVPLRFGSSATSPSASRSEQPASRSGHADKQL